MRTLGYKKGQNCANCVYKQTFGPVLKLVKFKKCRILTHSRFCKTKQKIHVGKGTYLLVIWTTVGLEMILLMNVQCVSENETWPDFVIT